MTPAEKRLLRIELHRSSLERLMVDHMCKAGVPQWEEQFYFARPARMWHFDFAWPDIMLALEVDGATWANGRHSRGSGIEGDSEKYCDAAVRGWRILRVTRNMIESGAALGFVRRAHGLV